MAKFTVSGIDDFIDELESTANEVLNIQAEDLFTDDFVRQYTQFSSYEEMLDKAVEIYNQR